MVKPILPTRLRGHPFAAAVFAGCSLAGFFTFAYGLVFTFVGGADGIPVALGAFNIAAGAFFSLLAFGIGTGRIATDRGLELAAATVLTSMYASQLAEMIAKPAHAQVLTSQCFLVMVAAGVTIRSRPLLASMVVGALAGWSVTVGVSARRTTRSVSG